MNNHLRGSLLSLLLLILFTGLVAQTNEYSLKQCIDYAWENSTDISRAYNSIESKQSSLEQSKAGLLPNLSLGLNQNYSISRNYVDSANGGSWESRNQASTGIALNSSVTLFNGAKLINSIRQKNCELSASEYELQTQKDLLSLKVMTAYINLLLAEEQVSNRTSQLSSTEGQLQLAQARKSAGLISQSDYINIKSAYASDKATLVSAESALRINLVSLMQAMNMPVRDSLKVVEPDFEALIEAENVNDAEKIYEKALAIRPDIKIADLKLKSAELGIKIAKADALPTVSLRGSLGTGYSDALSVPDFSEQFTNSVSPSVSLVLSVPIFQNKIVKNQVTQAKIQQAESQLSLMDIKNEIRKGIEQACTDFDIAKVSYEAAQERYNAELESYRLAEEMFAQGMINSVDYQSAKYNYINAQISLTQTKYNVLLQKQVINYFCGKPITF